MMAIKTAINNAGPTQEYFSLSDSASLIVIYFYVNYSNYVEIENQNDYHGIHQHSAENNDIGYLFSRHHIAIDPVNPAYPYSYIIRANISPVHRPLLH